MLFSRLHLRAGRVLAAAAPLARRSALACGVGAALGLDALSWPWNADGSQAAALALDDQPAASLPFPPAVDEITSRSQDPYERQFIQAVYMKLPLVQTLLASPSWEEIPAYYVKSEQAAQHNLTYTTLEGPLMLPTRPLMFRPRTTSPTPVIGEQPGLEGDPPAHERVVGILHLGRSLCGHQGVVHGGMLATVLDEMCARAAVPNLPFQTGFTAYLNISYRKPVLAEQTVVVVARITKLEGRKCFVKAQALTPDLNNPLLLAEAEALFISKSS